MSYFRLVAVLALFGACSVASEESIEDMMSNLKGMPGMEGVKMFSSDDLKGMDPDEMMRKMGGGRSKRPPPRRTRSQWKKQLISFYEHHELEDKVAGVDAALDKWKGREDKMWSALKKKYADVVDAKFEENRKKGEENRKKGDEAKARASDDEAAADAAFKKEL